ncbi:complement factor B-like protein [Labeo rohita]|uniref:C3/C5 convertase n=1 Tax=Labeo rohita TaxID=84645 RepID=A0A498ME15_LABRO|nr:complement factor B-like protein [Labeo rohita]
MECKQRLKWLMLAMICPLIAGAPSSMSKSDNSCPKENLNIIGGSFVLKDGYSHGSLLKYICPNGYYPSIQSRLCQGEQWTPKPKIRKPAVCKKITCPNPRVFENGEVSPYKDKYYVNDTTTYSCHSDYILRGSAVRVCKPNGKWNGSTPICGRDSDHCPDPGVPPGSSRAGNVFNIDDKVTYRCERPLTLIGSKVRVCQDGGQWSGTEPQCYADFTYDTPEEASDAFSSSLKSDLGVSQQFEQEDQQGKKITMDQGGKLDIYIAVDASDSIDEEDFTKAKTTIKLLIEKISYYPVSPNYEILVFATNVSPISRIRNFKLNKNERSLERIFEDLDKFTYDSQANMGGNPKPKVDQIKHLVTRNDPNREKKLDLYVFGVGEDVNQEDINDFVSHKDEEKHFFKLPDLAAVQQMFDDMIVVKVKKYVLHPKYNITAKKHMGIKEYYEFDVALVQLEKSVKMTSTLRPICIPCTKETNAALKLSESEGTCKKHGESGGATHVNKKGRVIQVGVISWGVKDICKGNNNRFTSVSDSRDFHSNLFSEKIRSFLKEHLENDNIGNPLTFL